jgi:hypothetical protein
MEEVEVLDLSSNTPPRKLMGETSISLILIFIIIILIFF